jgi:hypothetical protein
MVNFGRHFVEQEFFDVLAWSAGLAAGFFVVLVLVSAAARRFGLGGLGPFLAASAATLAVFVVGFTLFEAAALYLRTNGEGVQRHGADREHFVMLAKTGFALVYLATALVGAGAGYVLSRRRVTHPGRVAVGVVGAVLVFLLLALPFAEFLNACNIGEAVVLDARC